MHPQSDYEYVLGMNRMDSVSRLDDDEKAMKNVLCTEHHLLQNHLFHDILGVAALGDEEQWMIVASQWVMVNLDV
jgi:hypothetical protein